MPWTPPASAITWQDFPDLSSSVSAAHLNQAEGYSVTVGQSVVDYALTAPVVFVDSKISSWSPTTDVTTGFQSAMDAASAMGASIGAKVPLLCTPGRQYTITSVVPKSYVDLRCHGSTFVRPGSYATDHSFFFQSVAASVGSPITEFALRGATVTGTGTESAFQGLILLDRSSHITIEDCKTSGVASFLSYLGDCQHVRVQRNKALNGSVANQFNFVNGAGGSTSPLKYIWCENNFATCNGPMGIAVVTTTGANRTDPIVDAHLNHNTCTTTGSGWPMTIEQGGTGAAPNVSTFEIAGNTLTQNGTGLYALTLTNDSSPASNDPLCIADVTITGNRLYSLQTGGDGLYLSASDASITGNIIHATLHDIYVFQHGTAVLHHITETGNTGHHGSGSQFFINTPGSVDLTTLTSLNTP